MFVIFYACQHIGNQEQKNKIQYVHKKIIIIDY